MNKKLLIASSACVVFVVVICFLLFIKGGDSMNAFERSQVDRFLSVNPFIDEESGDVVRTVSIAAANNDESAERNSFLWFRNRYDQGTSHVLVNVAFNTDGKACLADSFAEANGNSVDFQRVVRQLIQEDDEQTGFVINLCEYGALRDFASTLGAFELERRSVVIGVNENALPVVSESLINVPVLCDYSSATKSSLEELKENGAAGIYCHTEDFSYTLLEKAKSLGMLVWVNCEDEIFGTLEAMYYLADGIVSSKPQMAVLAMDNWTPELADELAHEFSD